MDVKSIEKLELNKILYAVSHYASTEGGKSFVLSCTPSVNMHEVKERLLLTDECVRLLYTYGVPQIQAFANLTEVLARAKKGAVLTFGELLSVSELLYSARTAFVSVSKTDNDDIKLVKEIANGLYFDQNLEFDISDKIVSVDALSDHASEKLFSIRTKIKNLNAKIREKLSEYAAGKDSGYLQDSIVTMRGDRYVIPVKAEYKSRIRGFIHDRSKTGSTFFIEPEHILELNNELVALTIDEKEETEAILRALSRRAGNMADELIRDVDILHRLDGLYAMAEYSYVNKCAMPKVNDKGYVCIINGRHPLIEKEHCVPVSLELGGNYSFLLLSGANTGGKTVTLKMTGLFCLMAACGLFIPAVAGSSVSVFENVFCDIGDSQSIEESLSTFSSHLTNIINICNRAGKNSLVLIDELGGGTNPDEGQAVAKAVVEHLVKRGTKGIVTTHFTPLKEFAYSLKGIENASMEFDAGTLKPLYSIKIGLPGASNALAIARRLGMNGEILERAESYLSEGARDFENVVRKAEESRVEAQKKLDEVNALQREWKEKLNKVNAQIAELNREKEKINRSARAESRRIIYDRTEKAEEMLSAIEEIFKKEELKEADLINARTLKNKLKNVAFEEDGEVNKATDYSPATPQNMKIGAEVYVKAMECAGTVTAVNLKNGEAEVNTGTLKMHVKIKDLFVIGKKRQNMQKVKLVKNLPHSMPVLEINILGLTVPEALYEVDNFIDRAVTDNLEEVKIIHGVGTGKLRSAIHERLKKHKNVESFRLGKYGEGETGVTFVKLK